jgi:hypothetical protein
MVRKTTDVALKYVVAKKVKLFILTLRAYLLEVVDDRQHVWGVIKWIALNKCCPLGQVLVVVYNMMDICMGFPSYVF